MCEAVVRRHYRMIYRESLRAVQYAIPARYIVRRVINQEFRLRHLKEMDNVKMENTVVFLTNAADVTGLEHRVLKNLLHTLWWQTQFAGTKKR